MASTCRTVLEYCCLFDWSRRAVSFLILTVQPFLSSAIHTEERRRGWDQTGSNGANLSFPDALGIPVGPTLPGSGLPNPNAARNQWIQGVINAAPYIGAAFVCVQAISIGSSMSLLILSSSQRLLGK